MAGAIHKMAVYLGLVEDEVAYEDGYDSFEEDYAGYEDEELAASGVAAGGIAASGVAANGSARQPAAAARAAFEADSADAPRPAPVRQTADLTRITTLHPRTYNEARTIGEHFREGTPVIMNLSEMVDSDAKRLVDFAAGLIFGLRGSIDRVTNRVFLLSPASIEVTAEDKARIAERGFFNQS
jgi:cell division inhibitor SepF